MLRLLAAAALIWPMLLGAVVWHRATAGESVWTTIAHVAASRICHQKPERSFATAGVQWPVCGRCSGLYLGAAAGVLPALLLRRRLRHRRTVLGVLAVAAVPTAVTLAAEWLGAAAVGNVSRFAAALPLGAAIFAALLSAVLSGARPVR